MELLLGLLAKLLYFNAFNVFIKIMQGDYVKIIFLYTWLIKLFSLFLYSYNFPTIKKIVKFVHVQRQKEKKNC